MEVKHELNTGKPLKTIPTIDLEGKIPTDKLGVGRVFILSKNENILTGQQLKDFKPFEHYRIEILEETIDLSSKVHHIKSKLIEPEPKPFSDSLVFA